MKLPKMEKDCETCQDNVFEHRFFHRSYHLFCNACVFMREHLKMSADTVLRFLKIDIH